MMNCTRRGNDSIWVPSDKHDEYETMAIGWGADGMAGRIGSWDVVLLKAPKEGIVRVRTSGGGYGTPSDYYVIKDGKVYHCHLSELEECCTTVGFELKENLFETNDNGEMTLSDNWWKVR